MHISYETNIFFKKPLYRHTLYIITLIAWSPQCDDIEVLLYLYLQNHWKLNDWSNNLTGA